MDGNLKRGRTRKLAVRVRQMREIGVATALVALLGVALYGLPDWSGWPFLVISAVEAVALVVIGLRRDSRAWIIARRRLLAVIVGVFAFAALGLSAYYFRPTTDGLVHYRATDGPKIFYREEVVPYLIAGSLAFLVALALFPGRIAPWKDERRAWLLRYAPRWDVALTSVGLGLLWTVAEANGQVIGVTSLQGMASAWQLALLVGGLVALAAGLSGVSLHGVDWRRYPWGEIGLVAAITLVGLGLRLWGLDSTVRKLIDEGHYILGAMGFWDHSDIPLLQPMPTTASFPFVYSYFQSWAIEIFGRNLTGLRAVSALCGALTIPAVYALGRQLFDRRTALMAALVLATFPPHLHYSRLALNNIADPMFATWGLAALTWGLRANRRSGYVIGGVCLGLATYFYEGGRLLYPALAFGWLAGMWIVGRRRPAPKGIVLALVAYVIVAAPVYYTLVGMDFPLTDRLDKTELASQDYWARSREDDSLETRLVHFRHSLMSYVGAPENTFVFYYIYYGGDHPLVLEVFVPFFLMGVLTAVWRWRSPAILLVLWVLATSAGNALLVESAVSARYVLVFPALVLLIALGGRVALPLVWPGQWSERAQVGVLIALALGIAVGQGYYYFGPHLDELNRELREFRRYDAEDAMLRAATFPEGTVVYVLEDAVIAELDAQRLVDYVTDGVTVHVVDAAEVNTAFLLEIPRENDLAFFVHDPEVIQELAWFYRIDALAQSPYDIPEERQLYLYYVPALVDGELSAAGASGEAAGGSNEQGWQVVPAIP